MQSSAKTVSQYLTSLPPDRRKAIGIVRAFVKKHLPNGFQEGMQYGMIGYSVPLKTYPAGYDTGKLQPLPYMALASQKNYMALYLMNIYAGDQKWFQKEWAKTGKKLDMGKGCLRFKRVEDLALPVLAKVISNTSVKEWITIYEKSRKRRG